MPTDALVQRVVELQVIFAAPNITRDPLFLLEGEQYPGRAFGPDGLRWGT